MKGIKNRTATPQDQRKKRARAAVAYVIAAAAWLLAAVATFAVGQTTTGIIFLALSVAFGALAAGYRRQARSGNLSGPATAGPEADLQS